MRQARAAAMWYPRRVRCFGGAQCNDTALGCHGILWGGGDQLRIRNYELRIGGVSRCVEILACFDGSGTIPIRSGEAPLFRRCGGLKP